MIDPEHSERFEGYCSFYKECPQYHPIECTIDFMCVCKTLEDKIRKDEEKE